MFSLPKLLKKLTISLLVSVLIIFSFVPPVKADDTWYNPDFGTWSSKVFDTKNPTSIFGERYTYAQVVWIIYSLLAFPVKNVVGEKLSSCIAKPVIDYVKVQDCIKEAIASNPENNVALQNYSTEPQRSMLELIFEDRPLSFVSQSRKTLSKLRIIPEAQAQTPGFGFKALDPILPMWRAVRNIVYSLSVVVMIVLSFMIMFKVKLNPQTSITIQSAIPKVIIAMILVTFSYAIAGLLIDVMYVVFAFISLIGAQILSADTLIGKVTVPPTAVFTLLTKGPPVPTFFNLGPIPIPTGYQYMGVFGLFIYLLIFIMIGAVITFTFAVGFPTAIVSGLAVIGGIIAAAGTGIGGIILILILAVLVIILLIMAIKTFWMLLKNYVNIILLTIFAPFQIMAGVLIPNLGFGTWLKDYVSKLAVFVTTGGLFLLSFLFALYGISSSIPEGDMLQIIIKLIFGNISGGQIVVPSPSEWPPLLGGTQGATGLLFVGASFVLFTVIPKTAQLVESVIKGQPFNYGAAIGEAVGPAVFAGQSYADYRSGRERARIENEIRQAEAAIPSGGATWADVGRLRAESARRDFVGNITKQIFGGRR